MSADHSVIGSTARRSPAKAGARGDVFNPAIGEKIAEVPFASVDEVAQVGRRGQRGGTLMGRDARRSAAPA